MKAMVRIFSTKVAHLVRQIAYDFSGIVPKKNTIVLGAWFGKKLGDNSYAMLEQLVAQKAYDFKIYWLASIEVKSRFEQLQRENKFLKDVEFLKINSLKSLWIVATSKIQFISHGFQDLAIVPLSKNSILVQLWHGFPVKKIGADSMTNQHRGFKEGNQKYLYFDYIISSSPIMSKRILSGFKYYGVTEDIILNSGQPRTDNLLDINHIQETNINLRKKLKIPRNKKIVGYFPTFRDSSNISVSLQPLAKKFTDVVFIEKQHFVNQSSEKTESFDNFIRLNDEIDSTEILSIVDILITDVSSIYVDFALLNRPIIHYLFDGDGYFNKDRGIYADDFSEEAVGPIVYNLDDLYTELNDIIYHPENVDYRLFIDKFLGYENVNSSKLIIQKVFGNSRHVN